MPHPDDDKAWNEAARKLTEEAEALSDPASILARVEWVCKLATPDPQVVWNELINPEGESHCGIYLLDDAQLGQALNMLRSVEVYRKGLSWTEVHKAIKVNRAKLRQKIVHGRPTTSAAWHAFLHLTQNGAGFRPTLENAQIALVKAPELAETLSFDSFALRTLVGKPLPWDVALKYPREWRDQDDRELAIWLQSQGIQVGTTVAADAAATVAARNSFDPLKDWVESLQWDGTPRLTHMLANYFGAEDNEYTQAVGSKWMMSAIQRALLPGSKVDHCLVLKGIQGSGKSTAAGLLAMREEWFTDNIAGLDEKDAVQNIQGKWIIEFGDMARLPATEQNLLKNWITRKFDNFRPSYGRRSADHPRHCVFIATTNKDEFLADETGNRRWWPVAVGKFNLEALDRDREQLWAEAYDRFKENRETIFLDDPRIQAMAEAQQRAHYEPDIWDGMVKTWVFARREEHDAEEHYRAKASGRPADPYQVELADVLTVCLNMKAEHMTQQHRTRIARILRNHGYMKNATGQYTPSAAV